MLNARLRPFAVLTVSAAVIGLLWCGGESAFAQRGRDGQRHKRPGPRPEPPGAGLAAEFGQANPFRPSPEDFGPLRAGEEEELIEFTRQEMAHAYRLLERVRERSPEAYQRHLERLVPRIRHLRRIFKQDAELGRIIIRHSRNLWALQRGSRGRRGGGPERPQREHVRDRMRELIGENLRLEIQALERWMSILEQRRDQEVERELKRLTQAGEVELSAEPSEIREAVAAWQAASDPEQRGELRVRLRELVVEQVDAEVVRLGERVAELRSDPAAEVDRRLKELLERSKRRGPRREGRGERRHGEQEETGKRGPPPPRRP
jgi:hypothetical protein